MNNLRVIPILGIENRRLVKTIRYKNPKYIGDPINAIKIFNDKEVDELAIIDIRATLKNNEPDYDHLFQMAGEAFMPIAYGGGIKNLNIAKKVFDCGVEKVIVNSAFHTNKDIVFEIAETYGSQSIIISLDIAKTLFGKNVLMSCSGTKKVKKSLNDFLDEIIKMPIGEIILNDINRDGTFSGYNFDILHQLASRAHVPLIVNCGASSVQDFHKARSIGASGVAASSMFVYTNNNTNSILINYQKLDEPH